MREDERGPKLVAYIRSVTARTEPGTAITSWANRTGVNGSNIARWDSGRAPSIDSYERIANVLDRPLIEVLIRGGYVDADRDGRVVIPPMPPVDIETAITLDLQLSESNKVLLRGMLHVMRNQ